MPTFSPPTFEFIVDRSLSGIRIDSFLIKHLRNYTPWRIQRIVAAGGVRINNAVAEQTDRIFKGQTVSVRLIEAPDKLLAPKEMELEIIYQDEWLIVVNKPADLIVHPVGEEQSRTLANGLQHFLDQQTGTKGILRPGMVHRLDRQTSGAIAVALTYNAHAKLAGEFEASRVSKSYLAIVEGVIERDEGRIDRPIGKARSGMHVLMSCRPDAVKARNSKTNFRVLERFPNHTLVLARPVTGRNHQIRVHFAHIGHPLIGDEFYKAHGKFHPNYADLNDGESRTVETGFPIKRHALHAVQLEFAHPITSRWETFIAPLPSDFLQTLGKLRKQQVVQR
ncbi:RluA family pseudouridine synthase [Thalassoglobus sp.]|uniref:RluA family pseudouridine synthase n=1 Tax=Thalassoglobus sp. TaxID=2795869 RepID=UPI003AA99732